MLLQLRDLLPSSTRRDLDIPITLPEDGTLDLVVGKDLVHTTKQSTYSISQAPQALRQLASLLTILGHPLNSQDPDIFQNHHLSTHRPWLLDSLLALRRLQANWQDVVSLPRDGTLNSTINLLYAEQGGANTIAQRKVVTLLGLHCADMVKHLQAMMSTDVAETDDPRKPLSAALLLLAQAALRDRTVGGLAIAKILNPLQALLLRFPALGEHADFLVRP